MGILNWFTKSKKESKMEKYIVITNKMVLVNTKPSEIFKEDIGQYLVPIGKYQNDKDEYEERVATNGVVEFRFQGTLIGIGKLEKGVTYRGYRYYLLRDVREYPSMIKLLEEETV